MALEATAARVCDAAATDHLSTPVIVCPLALATPPKAATPTRPPAQVSQPRRLRHPAAGTPPDRRRVATSVCGTTRSRKPRKHGPAVVTPESRPRKARRKPQTPNQMRRHHATPRTLPHIFLHFDLFSSMGLSDAIWEELLKRTISDGNHNQPAFKSQNTLDISVNKRAGEQQIPMFHAFLK